MALIDAYRDPNSNISTVPYRNMWIDKKVYYKGLPYKNSTVPIWH